MPRTKTKKVLIISDSELVFFHIQKAVLPKAKKLSISVEWACTIDLNLGLKKINLSDKEDIKFIQDNYSVVISAHCRQIFPNQLLKKVRCINLHPGYNPYNRGWYPHIFSLLNGLPAGATLHEMDEKIDHGPIIDQKHVSIDLVDTSLTLYKKILQAEAELIKLNFEKLLENTYVTYFPKRKGNYNSKKDYEALLQLDLKRHSSLGDFLKHLRALSHHPYKNGFFINEDGEKIYVEVQLYREEKGK